MIEMATVLVIDDETSIAETVRAVLEDEGYVVQVARNGREGLARLEDARPDLVLSDVMMPELDGRELCRIMRADPAYRAIPIVLMSATSEASVRGRCAYTAFLGKPFDMDALLAVVATGLSVPNSDAHAYGESLDRRV
jgi:CheY-like chemotaxis protein